MILRRSLSTAKVSIESNQATRRTALSASQWTIGNSANGGSHAHKLMETQWYSLYFPINCYFSRQRVGLRVERAE